MESLLFSIDRYPGPDNFCDREIELERLSEMFKLKRNGVVYSYRRLGKTGLLQHFSSAYLEEEEGPDDLHGYHGYLL